MAGPKPQQHLFCEPLRFVVEQPGQIAKRGGQRRYRDPQGIDKPRKELERRRGRKELDDFPPVEDFFEPLIKLVVDAFGGLVQPVRAFKTHFFAIGERRPLKVPDARDLFFGCSLLLCQSSVGGDSIMALVEQRHARGHELLVPARQRAVTEQRLEKSGDPQRQFRRVAEHPEHVRHSTSLGQKGVVDCADFRRYLIAFERRDATLALASHQNAYRNENWMILGLFSVEMMSPKFDWLSTSVKAGLLNDG